MRFKAGELALIAVDIDGNGCDGRVVEILRVGPLWALDTSCRWRVADYEVLLEGDPGWLVMDIELRKIGDADPEQESKRFLMDMLEENAHEVQAG